MPEPYHIIATPNDNGYTVTIPEKPGAAAHCDSIDKILETGCTLHQKATQKALCPKCGQEYSGYPATSRIDGTTAICPDCGTREALDAIGMDADKQADIIAAIHELA